LKSPNVVLLVLDTLRGDFPGDLDRLLEMGFTKLDAVAPSSWTLPSHVSMFTGELPSSHGVRARVGFGWKDMMRISKGRLGGDQLLTVLKARGYTTYGDSANQFVSPNFGFAFDHFNLYEAVGVVPGPRQSAPRLPLYRKVVSLVMRKGRLGGLARWGALAVFGRMLMLFGVQTREKGSASILKGLKGTDFREPFFAFVNLMEAHQPYLWWGLDTLTARLSMLGRPPHTSWWKKLYPQHARLATARGVEIVSLLLKYDPLVIVTSDHGQMIGEKGKFGHGWSLDEPLLTVPMLIRLPKGRGELQVRGPLVSLTEVRRIVEKAVEGETCAVGEETAVAEAWGFDISDVRALIEREGRAAEVFAPRVRIFSAKGSVLLNRESGAIEECSPALSKEEAESLSKLAPADTSTPPTGAQTELPPEEEKGMIERLKKLGYE
jgi:hypothetical protein